MTADFDGDGQRDQVTLDRFEPSVLHVWLSTTGTTSVLRTRVPVICIEARDLDGDHRAELITHASTSALQIWSRKHSGFRSYQPRRIRPVTLRPTRHSVNDGPTEPASAIPWSSSPQLAMVATTCPRAPAFTPRPFAHVRARFDLALLPFTPVASRPPPSFS